MLLRLDFVFHGVIDHIVYLVQICIFFPSSRKLREQLKEAQEHIARLQEQLQCANK